VARALPDGWETLEASCAATFEIPTLRRLAAELPDDYTVFHGVHWTRLAQGFSVFGEIDFIVLGPLGQVVLIEQKSGALEETPEGLFKRYSDKRKSVNGQIQRSIESLQSRFRQGYQGRRLVLDYLLYCPEYRVRSPATAGIAPERIVDAEKADRLATILVAVVDAQPIAQQAASRSELHAFFSSELELAPDPGAMAAHARNAITRLSGGLATWARRLEFAPFRMRVIGTAGSGKTQLALRILEDAAAVGLRAQYVCFNRPLADRIAAIAPAGAKVSTFHMLGDRCLRAAGMIPDFSEQAIFDRLASAYVEAPLSPEDAVDVLVVDEGQDFEQAWADALFSRLALGGKGWWLEDSMQNLYDRPPVALPGWVTLRADINYRTPRDVLQRVTLLTQPGTRVQAASPLAGNGIDIATYRDFGELSKATVAAVEGARREGFAPGDVVLLTFCGRERSRLMPFDRLGSCTLRRFDGSYDDLGNPLYQDGEILIETVFRFKGQSAPCVILTEIDFESVDERILRRLYVGATRASMKLSFVMSERAAGLLLAAAD
jgi:hypothetical protein